MQQTEIKNTCEILGTQGVIIQILLATLSFSVLVLKRFKETPKRPWKIWSLDTSKQGISQLLTHFMNIIISLKLSQILSHDPCAWYFSINILDNSLGVFICISLLKFVQNKFLSSPSFTHYQSGNYYQKIQYTQQQSALVDYKIEPSSQKIKKFQITVKKHKYLINYKVWVVQLLIWNAIVILSKIMLLGIQIIFNISINQASGFLLSFCKDYPFIKLIFVIVVVPFIMNCIAFWVQDSSLKKSDDKIIIIENRRPSVKDPFI